MNLPKTIFWVNIFILITLLILSPAIDSISINNAKSDTKNGPEPMLIVGPIYVGDMYISGDGNPGTAVVRSTSEQSLKIRVPLEGADVKFKAKYYINCDGWNDHGYVIFWVRGAPIAQIDNGEFEEGYLYTTVPHCKPGNNIEWTLTSTYCYLLLPVPQCLIPNVDGGAGVFSLFYPYSNLQKLSISNKLLDTLFNKNVIMSGTIIVT